MKPKVYFDTKKQIEYWIQQYFQAKAEGKTNMMKIYEQIIIKLGGKIPKL